MPQTINLTQSEPGINPAVVSVVAWFYSTSWQYPQPPQAITPGQNGQPAEIAGTAAQQYANAHFLIYEGFSGRNGGGTTLGRGSEDTGDRTLQQAYPTATSVEQMLAIAFPPPGPA